MPKLAPKYVALLSKRFVFDLTISGPITFTEERVIYPDVGVVTPPAKIAETPATYLPEVMAEPVVELRSRELAELPLLSVEIRDVAQRRLVTVIEILSPVNKIGGGAMEYIARRVSLLRADVHLLEIDLLRLGRRIELTGGVPPAHYYIYLSRVQRRPYTQIWPVTLRQRLPVVPVSLLPPDADVPLDLQAAVHACFALVGTSACSITPPRLPI